MKPGELLYLDPEIFDERTRWILSLFYKEHLLEARAEALKNKSSVGVQTCAGEILGGKIEVSVVFDFREDSKK